ncbi:MAG TPA: cbb3-type cytochrome c oxidase subunit I [Candidatus Nanopelagicales bacterium]|jgi:cytochrome c oxidase subunit 1
MATDTTVAAGVDAGGIPDPHVGRGVWWRRPGLFYGVIGAVIGYAIGTWLGTWLAEDNQQVQGLGHNDFAVTLGYLVATIGWLAGMGALTYPLQKMAGLQPHVEHEEERTLGRYFRYTLDHKVVGVQYLVAMIAYFLVGGLFALAIRTELLSPTAHLFQPGTYLEIVGTHGTMMMMMMTSAIIGPFGNYFVPLMIGARRMAFPRLEALSFWITPAAFLVLLSGILIGGFPSGWTGYAPLSVEATQGMDAYLVAFGLMSISMIVGGFNIVVTVINHRAPGMTWTRLPLFVWGMLVTGMLMVLAAPVLTLSCYLTLLDRTVQTSLFNVQQGGSPYLWENLFWFFGHPEVYILALPGFGIAGELLPVFTRKPAFGYKTTVAGIVGVGLLSFFVWQHHLFDSGINADMRPMVMLTTEMISIPTGFIFLALIGNLWRAKIRLTVPMLFVIGGMLNFLIGGVSGVFLSDVPTDTVAHGSFFVMSHFHYTIMGGYIFFFFAGLYYWLPKMTGRMLDTRLGKVHFWSLFVFFNSTFLPLFAIGELGMPRRVFEYADSLQALNVWVSISAYLIGVSMLVFVYNFLKSTVIDDKRPLPENPWGSRGLEWLTSTPPAADNFVRVPTVVSGPYEYGTGAGPMAVMSSPGYPRVPEGVS